MKECQKRSFKKKIAVERRGLTFKTYTVSKILEEGHVKSMMILQRAFMKRLKIFDEANDVCVLFGTPFSVTTPLRIQRSEARLD